MGGRFVLKASGDEYSFSLKAACNSEILLTGERYTAKPSAVKGIDAIGLSSVTEERCQRKLSSAGQPHFVLRGGNHDSSRATRDGGVAAVRANAAAAALDDQTRPQQ